MSHDLKIEDTIPFASSQHQRRKKTNRRSCNLCSEEFSPRTVFDRYCLTCKKESDLFRFGEWLPELDAALTERLSA